MGDRRRLALDSDRVGRVLGCTAIALTLVHVAVMTGLYNNALPFSDWRYVAFFDLDTEGSLGTWFSTLILLFAGQLLLLQAWSARRQRSTWWVWWLVLAIGFHVMSVEEIVQVHEYVNTVVLDTHWTTYGAIIVAVVAIAYLPFLRNLPAKTMWLFVAAGIIYVGGAMGVERAATTWYEARRQMNTLPYNLWTALEECMEMAGIILFIHALLAYLEATRAAITVELAIGGTAAAHQTAPDKRERSAC